MNFLEINISNLPEACKQPDILSLIALLQKVLDIVFLILPIALIVLITIDVIKIIISSDDKASKTNTKTIITRTIFAVLLFFVPTIITVVMNVTGDSLGQDLSSFNSCMIAAESKPTRDKVKELYNQKMEEYKKRLQLETEARKAIQGSKYEDIADALVNLAKEQNGITADSNKCNIYAKQFSSYFPNHSSYNCTDWCATFAVWLAKNTKYNNGQSNLYDNIINKDNKMQQTHNWNAKSQAIYFSKQPHLRFHKSQYHGGTYTPKKGDFIFFDWAHNGIKPWNGRTDTVPIEHVEIVVEVSNGYVKTVGGNTGTTAGGEVKYRTTGFSLNDKQIKGYGSWYNN